MMWQQFFKELTMGFVDFLTFLVSDGYVITLHAMAVSHTQCNALFKPPSVGLTRYVSIGNKNDKTIMEINQCL